MAARLVDELPEGRDWIYEVKFDGYRALLLKNDGKVQIRSRNNKDMTTVYPSIATAGRRLAADRATLDGEIVAVDASGRPSFQALQHRSAHPHHRIAFYAFDLLHLDGRDLTGSRLTDGGDTSLESLATPANYRERRARSRPPPFAASA